ncbi:ras-related protein Rab-28-like [Chrysoperla carnea]|uniref:ras-related protein Rab-28-like n=1 Tax=Chrysoperla carnea TaxID=189513 RepID=UPI001D092277|nr:ras-related protein Rab-28-like [Chrysoperla carnea]
MSDSEDETEEKQLKVVFVGESNVGKTAIIKRYCYDEFSRQYVSTSGVDFFLKRILLPGSNYVSIKIFDVGGDALAGNMLDKYIFNSDIIILVYDITNLNSFELLVDWLDSIKSIIHDQAVTIGIFGNKCDCEHQRAIRLDKTQQFCRDNNLKQYTVSSRTGESVAVSIVSLVANHLGIKLSKAEQEHQTTMVKAEIEPRYTIPVANGAAANRSKAVEKKSSICVLQ